MRKSLAILFLFASLGATGLARADEDDCIVPMAQWQPREAVQRVAAERGVTVRRIKIDDGCYQIRGSDDQGRRIEVTIHPKTLEVLDIEFDSDGHRGGHDSEYRHRD